ncbi:hypothetical protein [Sediminibacterium ginsengisoli]|uniref:Uncharacterized protein n=1 Tax=Sediminibacterium ginsengisoli TaxID=413434 RepID=A0A1T4RZ43_9BACT|nr:hypothetical protein [Sediminibacterium ginsengisoli]SKA20831.1 hypothetical protein SAMN04488132_11636 [Sediminibacterium ginsengisoli]
MAYKRKNNQATQYMRWGIIGIVVIAVIAFGKSLLNKFSSGFAFLSAGKDQQKVNADLNQQSSTAIRTSFVVGVVKSLKDMFDAWSTSESEVVECLNSLRNAEEVQYASTYYQNAYGNSLKNAVLKELDSWGNPMGWFSKSHWSSLNKYVQDNLV